MWCERFISAYRGTPIDRLSVHYRRTSMLVETAGDEWWTEPVSGALDIAARLAELGAAVNEWAVVACQRTRSDGLIFEVLSAGGRDRQIFVVHRSARAVGGAIVRNHFYLTDADADGRAMDARPPFRERFEKWAGSLDRTTLRRNRAALHTGLSVVREYYASTDSCSRWRQYDREARFTCTNDGEGAENVFVGPHDIKKRYGQLALDYQQMRSQAVETCWSSAPDAVAVLVVGTVPEVTWCTNTCVDRKIVQFFVIDSRTKKILNDVLCIDHCTSPVSSSRSSLSTDDYDALSMVDRGSRSPRPHVHLWSPRSSKSSSSSSSSSSTTADGPSPDTSAVDAACSTSDYDDDDDDEDDNLYDAGELVELRTHLTANGLKIRCCDKSGQPPQPSNNNSLNPRQLFIGCVPLHVKYGQLKLLFEQFGEVTYVKVYESYSKQTGAKMMHNYAFLFFKNEASVDRAIAASPVPLDSNWNLNVSRPLRHTVPTSSPMNGD